MNTATNNFYLVEPYARKTDDVADAIYQYENSLDTNLWRGNIKLELAKVVSADKTDFVGNILGQSYSEGDLIAFDPTKIIKHFANGTKLVRDDAIVCLFNEEDNAPGSNKKQVIVKVERNTGLEMQNVVNGFYGTVMDISISEYWDEKSNVHNVKIGDRVILVNPYRAEDGYDVFKKVSTTNGFYVVSEIDAIACKIESEG